jgi:anti-anti-sigma factor
MAEAPQPTNNAGSESLAALIELIPEPCALVDMAGVIRSVNPAWRDLFVETGLGGELLPACEALFRWEDGAWPGVAGELRELLAGGLDRVSFDAQLAEPPERWCIGTLAANSRDGGYIWQLTDVTRWQLAESESQRLIFELRRVEELRRQSIEQQETINAQEALLAELSTPLLRINARSLVLPLIGAIDSTRAQRVVENLLEAVNEQDADIVLLDITGVPVVDTQVANVLIQCAKAVRLLGARMVLTGIRPDVAQTIVALGIDLGDIVTRANLEEGINYALRRR